MMDCHKAKKCKGLQQADDLQVLSGLLLAKVGSFLRIGDRFKAARLRRENIDLRPLIDDITEVAVAGERYTHTA